MPAKKPDVFTLIFERGGKKSTQEFLSLDLCLRAANKMIVGRVGLPLELRKNGNLLMASGSLHNRLREIE